MSQGEIVLSFSDVPFRKIEHLISGEMIKVPVVSGRGKIFNAELKGLSGYNMNGREYSINTNIELYGGTVPAQIILTVNGDKTKATGRIIYQTTETKKSPQPS